MQIKSILFVVITVTLFSSCRKEGCMNPTAINFDEKAKVSDGSCEFDTEPENNKAVVSLVKPVIDHNRVDDIEIEELLNVEIAVEDESNEVGIEFTMSSEEHGEYYSSVRGSNEVYSPRMSWWVNLPDLYLFDQINYLSFKVTDYNGLVTYYTREFEFKDTKVPEIQPSDFSGDINRFETSSIKYALKDFGGIKEISVKWYQYNNSINDFEEAGMGESYTFSKNEYQTEFNLESFQAFNQYIDYKVVCKVTDFNDNVNTIQNSGKVK